MIRDKCLICGGAVQQVIDLGLHPLADRFLSDRNSPDTFYPLVLDECPSCGLVQSRSIVTDQEKYVDVEYSYTAGHGRKHWQEFAASMGQPGTALEIGCNDGTLLQELQAQGWEAQGVDASPVAVKLAVEAGCKAEVGIFGEDSRIGHFDLIVANNTLNHTGNPLGFMRGVAANLKEGGRFVCEVPDFADMVNRGEFDQIYLEHTSYFTPYSLVWLMKVAGLYPHSYSFVPYHGSSIRFVATPKRSRLTLSQRVFDWKAYNSQLKARKNDFLQRFYAESGPVVAIGAAAKGNTFLNYYGLSSIDYVTDSSPLKIGKYTPGARIPIATDEVISSYGEVRVLPLAWNIPGLTEKVQKLNPNAKVITR